MDYLTIICVLLILANVYSLYVIWRESKTKSKAGTIHIMPGNQPGQWELYLEMTMPPDEMAELDDVTFDIRAKN